MFALFAPAVALGMAVGRVGCLLRELPGAPTGAGWGVTLDAASAARVGGPAGVPLHLSHLYEIAFHLAAFAVIWLWLRHRLTAPGETFVLYVAAYAVMRFLVEFIRGNEVVWEGITRPQLFLALTLPLLAVRLVVGFRRGRYDPILRRSTAPTRDEVSV